MIYNAACGRNTYTNKVTKIHVYSCIYIVTSYIKNIYNAASQRKYLSKNRFLKIN